ncbi:MAG: UDP-N-acetylmuramyl-tripeptide synthetase [Candidatus Magasanikbacteria bacterium]|nr:UDP-N-acetylmuramyl-tripeptide synthetase [Candidatus Magasanikbacteria bacterium]
MLHQLKALVPPSLIAVYHRVIAHVAALYYGNPSREMVVIGVTGTNGKTTTTYLIAKALEGAGVTAGCTTTALMKIGKIEKQNTMKMTMPGRFALQKLLRQMKDAGCTHVIIETSSQGLIQYRHEGIAYDIGVFTNLTPEHIEAHGGFENYKKAKKLLFTHLAKQPTKLVHGKAVEKAIILNADDEHASYYQVEGIKTLWYSLERKSDLCPDTFTLQERGVHAVINGHDLQLKLPGAYNLANALAALLVGKECGFALSDLIKGLESVEVIPGRYQRIEEGQSYEVIIDYAPEPESFKRFYEAFEASKHGTIIHVLGSCGGGRDIARRPILGQLAAKHADIVVVTNEDPYDDNPAEIIDQVADGARSAGKQEGKDLFLLQDRREAIRFAMKQAKPGDAVILTGKGNEAWICGAHGSKQPWSEEAEAREAIHLAV